ncbi:MAG: hypothetical protein LCH41_13910 [Armatimonadetes bacterium]|nr:hypothetical protein [Armatimonadota bacterium]
MKHLLRASMLFIVAAGSCLAFAQQPPTPEALVKRLSDGAKKVTYAGVRSVTMRMPEGRTRSFEERILRKGLRWVITYPDNSPYAGQAVYELEGKSYNYNAAKNEVRVAPSRFADAVTETIRPPRGGGSLIAKAGTTVASRSTWVIEAKDREGVVRQRIWVDRNEALILKREVLDSKGNVFAGFQFTSIRFNASIPKGAFDLPRGAKIITLDAELRQLAKEAGITPAILDPKTGYTLAGVSKMEVKGVTILRQFYVSETGRVSLMQTKKAPESMNPGTQSRRFRVYTWESGGQAYALIGEMDQKELEKLAKRVKLLGRD